MFLSSGAADEDVIEVDEDARNVMKYAVHQPLESLSCIFQAEWHAEELPESKRCDHSRFGYVLDGHGDLVVASCQVNLGKYRFSSQVGCEIANVWEGITVIYSGQVEATVVTARPFRTVSFWSHV